MSFLWSEGTHKYRMPKVSKFLQETGKPKNEITLVGNDRDHIFSIPVFIEGNKYFAMIDSGASVNLISKGLVNKLKYVNWQENNIKLKSFAGEKYNTEGNVLITLGIGNNEYLFMASVFESMPVDLIIGSQFLNEYESVIDFNTLILKLNRAKVQLAPLNNSELCNNNLNLREACDPALISADLVGSATICGNTVIRAQEVTMLSAYSSISGICGSITPFLKIIPGYIEKGRSQIPVYNQSGDCITLRDGYPICHVTYLEDIYGLLSMHAMDGQTDNIYVNINRVELVLSDHDRNSRTHIDDEVMTRKTSHKLIGNTSYRHHGSHGEKTAPSSNYVHDGYIRSKGSSYMNNIYVHEPRDDRSTSCGFVQSLDSCDKFSYSERCIVSGWLTDYKSVFAESGEPLGYNNTIPMKIRTKSESPIYKKPYRIPVKHQKEIDREIETMLQNNVIRHSTSPWSAPMVIVKKKDGSLRLCVDYRALNDICIKDKHPIPNIDETLARLNGNKYFSCFDLLSGYWQLAIHKDSIEKTAFATPSGHYEFLTTPMGLCNSGSSCQRLMNKLFYKQINKTVLVYLDDIIVLGATLTEHDRNVREVLKILQLANLKVKKSKCRLLEKEVEFLGHIINEYGIKPNPDKVRVIKESKPPKDKTQLKSFLGLCSFYRKFIKNFGEIAKPLNAVSSSEKFCWGTEQQKAWEELKNIITSDKILIYPNFEKPFIIVTDASKYALGGVLTQKHEGTQKPIMYISRNLSKSELNYSVYELELLAIIFALKKFRPYIYGQKVIVQTDHKPLIWLSKTSKRELNGRLARWIVTMLDFDIEIEYIPGKINKVADFLSRTEIDTVEKIYNIYQELPINKDVIIKKQKEDEEITKIIQKVKEGNDPKWPTSSPINKINFKINKNILTVKINDNELIIVPKSLREQIIYEIHRDKFYIHPGRDETCRLIKQKYYWPQMASQVNNVITNCTSCIKNKPVTRKPKAQSLPCVRGHGIWELIHMDLIGPITATTQGNYYIMVVVDSFSKYTKLVPLKQKTSNEVAYKFHYEIICQLGVPQYIVSDNGKEFINSVMTQLTNYWKIKHIHTSSYHPQANGKVERVNRDLCTKLKILSEEMSENWDIILPQVELALNIRSHRATGHTPFYLMFGRTPNIPNKLFNLNEETAFIQNYDPDNYIQSKVESMAQINKRVDELITKYEMTYNLNDISINDTEIKSGNLVYIDIPRANKHKLSPRYEGPYVVKERKSPVSFLLEHLITGHKIVVHRSKIVKKITKKASDIFQELQEEDVEEDEDGKSDNGDLTPVEEPSMETTNLQSINPYNLRQRVVVNYNEEDD